MVQDENACKRTQVYELVDGEREYQDALWGPTRDQGRHTVTEFLAYIRDYAEEALHLESRVANPEADERALGIVRKVAGLAVACMEQHGAPPRIVSELLKAIPEGLHFSERRRGDHTILKGVG